MADDEDTSDLDDFEDYDPDELDFDPIDAHIPPARHETDISALLTPRQRDYLQDSEETDIKPGSPKERTIRNRIRERFTRTMCDMYIISNSLEERDLKQVFEKSYVWGSIDHALNVLFAGVAKTGRAPEPYSNKTRAEPPVDWGDELDVFEDRLTIAINRYYENQGRLLNSIDISINIEEEATAEEIAKRIKQEDVTLDSMSRRELDVLHAADYIDTDEYMRIRGIFVDQ